MTLRQLPSGFSCDGGDHPTAMPSDEAIPIFHPQLLVVY